MRWYLWPPVYTHIRVLYEAQRFILIFERYYQVFCFEYFIYIFAYYLIRMYMHDYFFLRLYVRIFSDRLEFCCERFRVNFSRLTVIFNWSKYICILYINHSFKYLTMFIPLNYDEARWKNQFGNFTGIIANCYLLHLPYFVRSVDIFLSTIENKK